MNSAEGWPVKSTCGGECIRRNVTPTEGVGVQAIESWYQALPKSNNEDWIFRGQSNPDHCLESTLDRTARNLAWPNEEKWRLEHGIFRRFVRQWHLYDTPNSVPENVMEWLSLMRHYGAPTRLLDFTYSVWIAVLFAVLDAETEAVIYALDANWFAMHAGRAGKSQAADPHCRRVGSFRRLYGGSKAFLLKQNAWRVNDRIAVQQGCFIVPGNVELTWEQNLTEALQTRPKGLEPFRVLRIPLSAPGSKQALIEVLYRHGLTRASVYPGDLGAFGRSLGELAGIPNVVVPPDIEPLDQDNEG